MQDHRSSDDILRSQLEEGRSRLSGTIRAPRRHDSSSTQKRPFVAKGHDVYLKNLQESSDKHIEVVTLGDGATHVGKLLARDKYTITVQINGRPRTFYKHAIESFSPVEVTE